MAGKLGGYNLAALSAQAGPEYPDEEIEEGHLPLDEYNYSVFRLQRELGRTSSVGFLGVNKQRGGLYDRASGADARFTLPGNIDLNLEYAREWKSGVKSDDLIFAQLSRRKRIASHLIYVTPTSGNILIWRPALFHASIAVGFSFPRSTPSTTRD